MQENEFVSKVALLERAVMLTGATCALTGHTAIAELALSTFILALLLCILKQPSQEQPWKQIVILTGMLIIIAARLQSHDFIFAAQTTALMTVLVTLWRVNGGFRIPSKLQNQSTE